jgi:subtilisin family serine protease
MRHRIPPVRPRRRWGAVGAVASLLVASMTTGAVSASASPVEGIGIDNALHAQLADGAGEFFVYLTETADLSGAAALESRVDRATHVFEQLTSHAEATQADLRADLEARGVDHTPFWISNTILVAGDQALAEELAARPDVSAVAAPDEMELFEVEPVNTISQFLEWGVADVGADHVWNVFGTRGKGIVVASIDTGVQFDHPALVTQYRGNFGGGTFDHNYHWHDPSSICPAPAPCDNNGHGTHVTGTMVGDDGGTNQIGVAPDAQWIAAKGCEFSSCSQAALLSSGQWMLAPTDLNGQHPAPDMAPHVVNNSWGGPSGNPWYNNIIDAWVNAGIFPVFAAGNSGGTCGSASSPGDYVNAYAVGAHNINHQIAPFSGRGVSQMDGVTVKPNITAPGVSVRSSIPGGGYGTFSGTSMAAPHVAGAVALVWSDQPRFLGRVAFTRHILDATAFSVNDLTCGGTPANNNVWGQGRLDAFQAVWLARTI